MCVCVYVYIYIATHTVEGYENNRNICEVKICVFLFNIYIYIIS